MGVLDDVRERFGHDEVQLGNTSDVRATLADMSSDARGSAEIRIAAAATELAEGCAEQAVEEELLGRRRSSDARILRYDSVTAHHAG